VGQLLHGSARTTAALRRTIQHSQESIAHLAARYDRNAKTVAKGRKRTTVAAAPMGPRQPHSAVRTAEQETMIVAFRKRTLLPLDDCLYALQASIPHLTRASRQRCLRRTASAACPKLKGTSRRRRSSLNIQSATSILILPRFTPGRDSAIFLSPLTARRSSLTPSYILPSLAPRPASSYAG
jgi:hypothetical protein